MAGANQQRCVNGTLDDAGYSSPVPVIGLYVAGATLVCFLFIFLDILAGFRNRKRWLPCRLFSLDSVTLTLLSLAAKIPVDLTTVMPTPHDQLSKLTEIEELKELIEGGGKKVDVWTLRKGIKDMNELMQANTGNHIFRLICRRPPSPPQESLAQRLECSTRGTPNQTYKVSSLSVVILAKISDVSRPSNLVESLTNILNEVFDVVHFVDWKMNSSSYEKVGKSRLARAAWKGDDFTSLLSKIPDAKQCHEYDIGKAIGIIGGLKETFPSDPVWVELGIITDFITSGWYGSTEQLYDFIEQLFVDMLNEFFIQLPNAIYKDIVESRPEDFEDKIRFALKAISRFKSLERFIQWAYPSESTIANLMTDYNVTVNV